MPLYEDTIGEVLFDVFYFQFSLMMFDNKMVLTIATMISNISQQRRHFKLTIGRLGQQFLAILERLKKKLIVRMAIFLKIYTSYIRN